MIMPRFFFNLRDGEYISDDTGVELGGVEDARKEAVGYASGLLKDDPGGKFWSGEPWRVEVTDDAKVLLFALTFSVMEPGNSPAPGRAFPLLEGRASA
jgi:hypothetical protein